MKYIELFERSTLIPDRYDIDILDLLYDNHSITTDVKPVESGFITPSGRIINTSNIDDHGQAILNVLKEIGISINPRISHQTYINAVTNLLGLVRFRQNMFIEVPSTISNKQLQFIKILINAAFEIENDFNISSTVNKNYFKTFNTETSKPVQVLGAINRITSIK